VDNFEYASWINIDPGIQPRFSRRGIALHDPRNPWPKWRPGIAVRAANLWYKA
jgi:hypothetical protein